MEELTKQQRIKAEGSRVDHEKRGPRLSGASGTRVASKPGLMSSDRDLDL